MALTDRKAFKVYLAEEYYDNFKFNEEKNIYQGEFGYLDLESVMKAIEGLLPHIKVEVVNE